MAFSACLAMLMTLKPTRESSPGCQSPSAITCAVSCVVLQHRHHQSSASPRPRVSTWFLPRLQMNRQFPFEAVRRKKPQCMNQVNCSRANIYGTVLQSASRLLYPSPRLRQALSLARNARLRALGSSSALRSLIDFGVTSTSSSSSI
jgi:hypothetical protein